jgi:hypothetical protein
MTSPYKKQSFKDEDMKLLAIYLCNSNAVIYMPMQWKHMRDFLNDQVQPFFGKTKGVLNIYGTQSAIEGLDEKTSIAAMSFESIAAYRVMDMPEESEDDKREKELRRKHLDLQERQTRALEKHVEEQERGEDWRNSGKPGDTPS